MTRNPTHMLNQRPLMLERVPLTEMIQLMIQMLVDLATGPILHQQAPQHSQPPHPEDLLRHACVRGTLPLAEAAVSANAASSGEFSRTGSRVHGDLLADDEAIGDELADGLAGVGVGDLGRFVGVEPDLAFAAAGHGGGEAFLGTQIHARDGGAEVSAG